MGANGGFEDFQSGFYGNQDVMSQMFPGYDVKQQDVFAYPRQVDAPLSSYDSTIPSTVSDGSMPAFPSLNLPEETLIQTSLILKTESNTKSTLHPMSCASIRGHIGSPPIFPSGQKEMRRSCSRFSPAGDTRSRSGISRYSRRRGRHSTRRGSRRRTLYPARRSPCKQRQAHFGV